MKFVKTGEVVVGPFNSLFDAEQFVAANGGDLLRRALEDNGATHVVPPNAYRDRRVSVVRQQDGSWTIHPQHPLPSISTFLPSGGWRAIAQLRSDYGAVEWFRRTADFEEFCNQFGAPPTTWPEGV
jgi:hypothetical protein